MKKFLILFLVLMLLCIPVRAEAWTAPEIPEQGAELMPNEQQSFGQGLWHIVLSALEQFKPDAGSILQICMRTFAVVLLLAILRCWQGSEKAVIALVRCLGIALILLEPSNALIRAGADTVRQISEYGKLLLPVMAGALASQGGVTGSTALYTATAVFDTVLTSLISSMLIPMVYIYLVLALISCATGENLIKQLMDFLKWLMTWSLKILLYAFTGYISITGVISGVTDQTALKTAKMAISGAVPVVGGILSDASEAVLVGAGLVKSTAGIYGMLAMIAIVIGPFLRIGAQYVLLKLTAAACAVISEPKDCALIDHFSVAMGFLLAMTGAVCLMQMISIICFMKGMG